MDEILSDKTMDRLSKIDKLEAILSAATLLPTDPVRWLQVGYYKMELIIIVFYFQIYSNAMDAVIPNYNNYGIDYSTIKDKKWVVLAFPPAKLNL